MAASTRAVITLTSGLAIGLALVGSLGSTSGTVLADTLLIENVDAAQQTTTERPKRGSSMASVEARFGPPTTRFSAVGKPPITRWDYANFAVYFEYDHVLHSVRR
jgi:hypothetical protein